jgi:MOSC domain-containing protein YiiM
MSTEIAMRAAPRHLTAEELAAGWAEMGAAPRDVGRVELIVARPESDRRVVLARAELSPADGLDGDRWRATSWLKLPDGGPDPAVQITLMNARAIRLIAGDSEHWPLAGDNLFVDLDLSRENLPVGTRLVIGEAILEIAEPPHNGCVKFKHRFGPAALAFVNSPAGKAQRLRGVHARVVQAGTIAAGDAVVVVRH